MVIFTNPNLALNGLVDSTSSNVAFSSSYNLYETQWKATIEESEFNFSQNPSIISGSTDGTLYDFTTGSFFQPYATTVGLYNPSNELCAVAKLSRPLVKDFTKELLVRVKLDY